jgi:hypothetical protein
MKQIFLLSVFVLTVNLVRINALDTELAKEGTCLDKIKVEHDVCNKTQENELNGEKDDLSRNGTSNATSTEQQTHPNKIECCAFWTFLTCIEKAADQKCFGNKTGMEIYTGQQQSKSCSEKFPREVCSEKFASDPAVHNSSYQFVFTTTLCVFSIIVMFLK